MRWEDGLTCGLRLCADLGRGFRSRAGRVTQSVLNRGGFGFAFNLGGVFNTRIRLKNKKLLLETSPKTLNTILCQCNSNKPFCKMKNSLEKWLHSLSKLMGMWLEFRQSNYCSNPIINLSLTDGHVYYIWEIWFNMTSVLLCPFLKSFFLHTFLRPISYINVIKHGLEKLTSSPFV